MTAADGVVRVVVDVTDDHVVWDGSRVDHVEVQLADEGLVADTVKGRRDTEQQWPEIEKALEDRDPTLVEAVRREFADTLQGWGAAERAVVTTVVSSPRTPAAGPASSRYARTNGGYRATLTIPLAGVLSPTSGSVKTVRYRVTVSDVDGDAAPVTSALPANSDDTPSTFARLVLPRRWRPRLTESMKVARDLAPGGYFDLRSGAYVYVLPELDCTGWTFDGSCCTDNVCWRKAWSTVEVKDVSRLAGTRLYVGDDAVLFVAGARRVRLKLADAEPLFQARRGGAYYLVFIDNQPSRPGNPMGQCGGGTETSVVWIKLSPALVEEHREEVLIDSCWSNLEYEPHVDATGVSGESERVDEQTGAHTAHLVYAYDHRHPQRGLNVRESPAH